MNILFFNRSFYPDVEATGQFLTELCEDLVSYGHNVTVIVGKSYQIHESKNNSLYSSDKYKGINVIRVFQTKLPKQILLCRLINLGTYFLFSFLTAFFIKPKPDVVVAQTDPPLMGFLGYFFSRLSRARFVHSCKDIYPEIGIITGKLRNRFLNLILNKVNLFSYTTANKILCLGEDMKEVIVKKGVDKGKIEIFRDWADTSVLYPLLDEKNKFKQKHNFLNNFIVMYSGNIGLTQRLDKILNVADHFKEKNNIQFVFIGDGAAKKNLQNQAVDLKLDNVQFLPYLSKEDLIFSLNAPNIHLVTLQKGLSGYVVPSKTYGILACGKASIAWIDKDSDISHIAEKYKCGIVVPPDDVPGMISAIEWSVNNLSKLEEMGKRGREIAVRLFDRKISSSKFDKYIAELCK